MAAIAGLQGRVEAHERQVFGPSGARQGAGSSAPPARPAADGLVKVQVALGNIASKRERIKILYKKKEQFILSQVALLEQVNNLQPFLDSAHIKAAPDHAAKLQRLAQIHIQQQAVTEFITSNKSKIIEHWMY
ncbi:dynactin subunit 3 isoform X2 [Terrapene carolina triunguis]|uniref:dynactin subunit 3 isoform X2 n=1 Tax=Terrapene triunguis TaxID=2587831 RepID=UPI000E778FEB|nr:dynactin subunit 3 isoform X2 [Terrapene carolina triunguis]